jgi:hypothetical protein
MASRDEDVTDHFSGDVDLGASHQTPSQPPQSRKPEPRREKRGGRGRDGKGLCGRAKPPRKEYRWDPIWGGALNPL